MSDDFDTAMEEAGYIYMTSDNEGDDDRELEMVPLMTMVRGDDGNYTLQRIAVVDENDFGCQFQNESIAESSTTQISIDESIRPANSNGSTRKSIPNLRTEEVLEKFRLNKNKNSGKSNTQKYRSYSDKQIVDFVNMIIEQHSVKYAASKNGITLPTAYRLRKIWEKNQYIPVNQARGPKKCDLLKEEHIHFILSIIDNFAPSTLDTMRVKLYEEFGISISKSSFHRFIKKECCLSMKKLEKFTEYRTLDETLEQRKDIVQSFIDDPVMNYEKNCVFLDESGFNLYMCRTRGWSIKGSSCVTAVPKSRGTSVTILGAMCHLGLLSLSLRKTAIQSKKRNVDGVPVDVRTKTGTKATHFLQFITSVLDELDFLQLHGYYIVMDNASIHKSKDVRDLIEARGYICTFLPTFSPFLNPIEEMWSKVKYNLRRSPFETGESLTPRIMNASATVTQEDCQGWIRHSRSKFEDCLNKVIL